MANSQYKLTYFNLRGIAEPIRFIFAYAGVNFEDERIQWEDWPAKKLTTPFHSIPILEVDGEVIGQSNAIARFLAKRFNLTVNGDLDQARADALVDYISDAREGIRAWFREQDQAKKAELLRKYQSELLPEYLSVLEQHLKRNGGGQGFFLGNSPTWVDFSVANFCYTVNDIAVDTLNKYVLVKEHMERVNNLKGIKEYIANRPETAV